MGLQTRCHARFGRRTSEGKAHLESDRLSFRGDFRVTIPFSSVKQVSATESTLRIEGPPGVLSLDLGRAAAQWANNIRSPRSRLDKLGVKSETKVSMLGISDERFERELRQGTHDVSHRLRKNTAIVFLGVRRLSDLNRLPRCRGQLVEDGAVWIIYPKGQTKLTRGDVMRAGKQAGLVDIKVVAFSDTHTALKFVIPTAQRSRAP